MSSSPPTQTSRRSRTASATGIGALTPTRSHGAANARGSPAITAISSTEASSASRYTAPECAWTSSIIAASASDRRGLLDAGPRGHRLRGRLPVGHADHLLARPSDGSPGLKSAPWRPIPHGERRPGPSAPASRTAQECPRHGEAARVPRPPPPMPPQSMREAANERRACAPAHPDGRFSAPTNGHGREQWGTRSTHGTGVRRAEGAAVIRVLLVHDECLVRSVLAEWLRGEPDLRVYDTPWRGASGRVRSVRPDVCAADLECADAYGIPPLGDLCARGQDPAHSRLLVLVARTGPAC